MVRSFLAFVEREGYAGGVVVGDFKPPRGKTGFAPRVLSQREFRRLLDAPDRRTRRGKRDALVLACLGVGGLRAGEVCRLDRDDVRITDEKVVLRVHGKRRRERLVTLPRAWMNPLRKLTWRHWPECREDGPLFFCGQPGHETRRLTVAAVDYLVRQYAAVAGLTNLTAHSLRHTMATLAIEAGEPIHRVRDRLGHRDVSTTMVYAHVLNEGGRGMGRPLG